MDLPLQPVDYVIQENSFLLYEPHKEFISASYQKGDIHFPYWSQVWPAAIGLAQFLLQHPQYVAGKRILELAAGLGLPSLVAATHHAAFVTTSDYAPEAVAAMRQTIDHHRLSNIAVALLDWTNFPDDLFADVLLLSDVSYDEKLFAIQEKVIRSFLQNGTTVIISTPQRLIAKQALLPLLPYCTHHGYAEIVHQNQTVSISIFVLHR